jgi:outer membrane receptor protein involved in Fe transport
MANRNVARAVRVALVSAGAMGAGLYGATGMAQEALQEIVITGSRIVSSNLESVSPLQIISSEDIKNTGVANIQELLLQNPAMGTPTYSRTNSNFLVTSAGIATVDLRNLGTARTLVLVNGRRFVAGLPGDSAVDMNAIPTQFIERVDILTGGASAAYGSDAVAGVVNIIYKKDFEGVEVNAQYGASAEGDDTDTQFNVTMGLNSSDGRGNIMGHLAYSRQGAVFSRDRPNLGADVDQITSAFFVDEVTGNDFFTPLTPFYSSFPPQGRFSTGTAGPNGSRTWTFNPDGTLYNGFSTNGSATRAPDGFNRSAFRTIAVPTERYLAALSGNYEFMDGVSAFIEGTVAATQVTSKLEPFPLGSDDIYSPVGAVPIEFNAFGSATPLRNPFVPDAVYNAATDTDGDGLRDIQFVRRLVEVGARGNTADRETLRVLTGLEGTFGNNWNWDVYAAYGQTIESQVSGGQVNVQSFRYALEAVPDILDVDDDGDTTNPVCIDPVARDFGCVPANVFGFGSLSQGAVDFITAPGLLATFTSQKLAGANLSGEVFDLPAGPLAIAVGAEYRQEFSRSEFDPLQQAGLNAGNAIPRTEGQFDVMEGYLEANVPILPNDLLTGRAAIRFSDYSTVGNTESWNVGLDFQPIPQLRFRGAYAETVRAPNINELFSPPSQTFPPGLSDPCEGVTAATGGDLGARCLADPGVALNVATNGSFTLNQSDLQGISGFNLGNPDLSQETGQSVTFGVVITPDGIPILENFGFTIDYFKIDIEDAIVSTPRQFILDQCYTGDTTFCQYITRRPQPAGPNSAGSLEFIDSAPSNSGGEVGEGIDVTVSYAQNIGPGLFGARLTWTHALDGYQIPLPGAPKDPYVGEIGASEDRAFLSLAYNWSSFGFTWRQTYIGPADLDDAFLAGFDIAPGAKVGVDAVFYTDVQFQWRPNDTWEVYVGADNLFDEKAPPIITQLPGSNTGTETDAGTYDPIGQRFYGGVRVKF